MTDEERDVITRYIERVSGAGRALSGPGSVPGTVQTLPPIDPDADRLIGDLFGKYPEARYRLTQTAFVQEQALNEAGRRIAQLQTELDQAKSAQTAHTQSSGGFFKTLFGGGQTQTQPPPPSPAWNQSQPQYAPPPPQYAPQPQYAQPQYAPQGFAPGYQPGMFARPGSGFLGSALTTAAGVAGGMVAGNALMNLFEGHHGYGDGFGGGGFGGGGYAPEPGPWAAPAPDAQVTGSAWDNQTEQGAPAGWNDPAAIDPGGADPAPDQGGGWDAGGDTGGGGWDDSNNGGGF